MLKPTTEDFNKLQAFVKDRAHDIFAETGCGILSANVEDGWAFDAYLEQVDWPSWQRNNRLYGMKQALVRECSRLYEIKCRVEEVAEARATSYQGPLTASSVSRQLELADPDGVLDEEPPKVIERLKMAFHEKFRECVNRA